MGGGMRFGRFGIVAAILLLAIAGPIAIASGGEGGGAGAHVDLVVRKVSFTPVHAHAGDVVSIEMVWEYWGDIVNTYYDTTFAEIRANGKVVAKKPFTYDYGARLGEAFLETFLWDTKGMAPGEYRIRGDVFLWLDATPYDNFLDVKRPLVLHPAGAAIPASGGPGGTAVAENPFWVEKQSQETKGE